MTYRRSVIVDRLDLLVRADHTTRAELAMATEASKSSVTRWMTGKIEPPVWWLSLVADYFGVSLDFIVGRGEHTHRFVCSCGEVRA